MKTRRPIAALALLLAVPALAAGQDPSGAANPQARPPAAANSAVLKGRVTNKAGVALPDARVRAAIPVADMRFVDFRSNPGLLETRSDANGDYRLEVPGLDGRTKVSIDVLMPGYRRLSGTLMQGGDARRVDVEPGREVESSFALNPARYISGLVVDEAGRPVPGADVGGNFQFNRASGGIERTSSGPDGSFELFNYSDEPHAFGNLTGTGAVYVSHPDYLAAAIEDIDALGPELRKSLRVVLPTGRKVAGVVLDSAGKPIPDAVVEATDADGNYRKATRADADGRFTLKGLRAGPSILTASALEIKQKAHVPIDLERDKAGLSVRLRPIELPAGLVRHAVLGMQLADVTPELKSVYDLYFPTGAVILDPGPDSDRLKIGELGEGYSFWMVGQSRVGSVREFVDRIIAEAGDKDAPGYSIRVVYRYRTPEEVGNNTQYLKLTRDDIRDLRAISERLRAGAK